MASVLPLPFVPAMWTTGGRWRSGLSRAARRRSMRPSERSMLFGCSAFSRSRIRSLPLLVMGQLGHGLGKGERQLGMRLVDRLGHDPGIGGTVGPLQQVEEMGQRLAQLEAMDHLVQHAVRQ